MEFAEQEFERFVELNDLDFDLDGDDTEDVKSTRRKLIKAIAKGYLTIDERGVPTVHPKRTEGGKPVVFSRLMGACMLASDKRGSKENVAKTFAAISEATGTPSNELSAMHVRDALLCQTIIAVFLA